MTHCERLGVCNSMNCKDCQLARDKSNAKRNEADKKAKELIKNQNWSKK